MGFCYTPGCHLTCAQSVEYVNGRLDTEMRRQLGTLHEPDLDNLGVIFKRFCLVYIYLMTHALIMYFPDDPEVVVFE